MANNQRLGLGHLVGAAVIGEEAGDVIDLLQRGVKRWRGSRPWTVLTGAAKLAVLGWIFLLVIKPWAAVGVFIGFVVLVVVVLRLIPRVVGGTFRWLESSFDSAAKRSIDTAMGTLFPQGGYDHTNDSHRKRVIQLACDVTGTNPAVEARIRALIAEGYPVLRS